MSNVNSLTWMTIFVLGPTTMLSSNLLS